MSEQDRFAALIDPDDWEAAARERLSEMAYGYYAGGAWDEVTVQENREAFARHRFAYRTLVDVGERDLSIDLLGLRLPSPIMLAPTAAHRLAHPDGECATARGAAAVGALMTVSSLSTVRLEEIAAAAPETPLWFQLYCAVDREVTASLVGRAGAAGYRAIVVTVDTPVFGRRERDIRNRFHLPEGVAFANYHPLPPASSPPTEGDSQIADWMRIAQTPRLTVEDLRWLRTITSLPIVVKGIVRPDDARRALDGGVDAVWVSNHGGRQLDRSIATAEALPGVVRAVDGAAPVIVDGGIRRGTDALAALAMGARAVAVGRPQLWGLAVGGAEGVRRVLGMLRDELDTALALAGCRSPADADPGLLSG